MVDMENKIGPSKVLYLAGSMRSGSTLVGMILGNLPGFFNVGEIKWFWSHAAGSQKCGCGAPLGECSFWSRVISNLESRGVEMSRMATLGDELTRTRSLLRIASKGLSGRTAREWEELSTATQYLYQAVAHLCGGKTVVDGSKVPPQLMLLLQARSLDLSILHLVRDGRAVAYSWEKRQRARGTRTGKKHAGKLQRSAYGAMLVWMIQNVILERLARRTSRTLLRYEDFAGDPQTALGKALERVGIAADLGNVQSGDIDLPSSHSIGGSNRVRFGGSRRRIVLDDEWRSQMAVTTRLALTAMGVCSLRRFGYL